MRARRGPRRGCAAEAPRLKAFDLTGRWRFRRRIRDARLGLTGRSDGRASFTPVGGLLRYDEAGWLHFGKFQGPAARVLVYEPDGSRLRVRFEDGRPFFDADLSTGRAPVAHACPPDDYEGEMRLRGPDRWTLLWRVRGPRKALVIATAYRRDAAPCRHQDILI